MICGLCQKQTAPGKLIIVLCKSCKILLRQELTAPSLHFKGSGPVSYLKKRAA